MGSLLTYRHVDPVATITMDDGKANVMSLAMQGAINTALDRALSDDAVVVVAGRDGFFSAGFDLATIGARNADSLAMVLGGFELAQRLLSFPRPVVMACTGHAIAMGAFLLLSGDYRVGAAGPFQLTANEVAIGMTMPYTALAILEQRLTPAAFNRAVMLAERFSPENGVEAGFLDLVVPGDRVVDEAENLAARLAALHPDAHAASKLRARVDALEKIRVGIERDRSAFSATIS